MEFINHYLLSLIVFFPLLWGLFGLALPRPSIETKNIAKYWAFLGSSIVFVFSILALGRFQGGTADFQLVEKVSWINEFGIFYYLGIDGISLWLVILTAFIMPLAILASFSAVQNRTKEYYFLLLCLESGMLGAFLALDAFLFYVFWEAMLIPMYFIIGIWGGKERIYASMKLFLYTVFGSLLMLVAIFYLSYQHASQYGVYSTLIEDLYRLSLPGGGWLSVQSLLFLAFAIAFAIKVPLFPFHTWLPDAHVQAPTAGSVILAAILLKLGGYGFLRFAFPLFPEAVHQYQFLFLALGAFAIIYGAWVAMIQPDIKKLVAYSSVSHMGYVIVGLFSLNLIGTQGSIYQMLNHGISTGALFLLVGMIYERRHTREISEFGGITRVMPLFAVVFMLVTLSSVALPGTNGFVGEFLILLGTWQANRPAAIVAALGVIFGAIYMLWMFQRVMFGPIRNPENENLSDLSLREISILVPFVVLIFYMGFFPSKFLDLTEPSVAKFLDRIQSNNVALNFQVRKGNR